VQVISGVRHNIMKEKIKKFEISILRPAQLILILLVIIFGINKFWFLLAAGIMGLFYLGIIGGNLHPLQSAADLAKGPLTTPAAKEELKTIPPKQSNILVGHACTRIGILLGFGAGITSFNTYHMSWFLAVIIGLLVATMTGTILKVIFKTAP